MSANLKLADAIRSAGHRTGQDFARKVGISPITLSATINGRKSPRPVTIARICRELGKSPADLGLAGEEKREEGPLRDVAKNLKDCFGPLGIRQLIALLQEAE